MNPSDIIEIQPPINVAGVILANSHVYDTIGSIASVFPPTLGVVPTDTTLNALIKTAVSNSYTQFAGSMLSNNVAQVIQDVSFTTTTQSYVAGLASEPGNIVNNIFNYNTLTGHILEVESNYLIKHIGANIDLIITSHSGSSTSSTILTSGNDVGVYNNLEITFDGDPFNYPSDYIACKYKATTPILTSSKYVNTIKMNERLYQCIPFLFYVDSQLIPSLSSYSIIVTPISTYISGIPRYINGTTLQVTTNILDITSEFYNNTQIVSILGNSFNQVNYQATNTDINNIYNNKTTPYAIINTITINNVSVGNLVISARLYSASASITSALSFTPIFIDCLSNNESQLRVKSSSGQFPSTSSLTTYNSSQSLLLNEELQYILGYFIYPQLTNWSTYNPVGPNYSAISGGSYNGYRWMTQKISINATIIRGNVVLNNYTIIGTQTSPLLIYLSANNTWYDVLSPFIPPLGTTIGILEYSGTTSSNGSYFVTFGTGVTTQDVYIRIGLKNNTNIKFTSVSFSSLT